MPCCIVVLEIVIGSAVLISSVLLSVVMFPNVELDSYEVDVVKRVFEGKVVKVVPMTGVFVISELFSLFLCGISVVNVD